MPDRWERVKELFEAAQERPAWQRASFLARVCAGDDEMRAEVQSLLQEYDRAGSFLDRPSPPVTITGLGFEPRELSLCGRMIANYRIHEQIGKGGMGAVYRAEETGSGREVALKFLAQANADGVAVERFRREARIAASLVHPNICAFYGLGEAEGNAYIAMELLRGQTLHESIFRKPAEGTALLDVIPFRPVETETGRAFEFPTLRRIALEALEGLAAAHAKNIAHRDIKPANIFVTREGRVKILDFGLAKLVKAALSPEIGSNTDGLTLAGTTLGTLTYMSPEQIRGEKVDARTDIFSFGAVLFEMATGRRTFEGRYIGQALDSIMKRTPPAVEDLRPEMPRELSRVIFRALEKNRERRFQTAREMAEAIAAVPLG